jgi:hypothetical protein
MVLASTISTTLHYGSRYLKAFPYFSRFSFSFSFAFTLDYTIQVYKERTPKWSYGRTLRCAAATGCISVLFIWAGFMQRVLPRIHATNFFKNLPSNLDRAVWTIPIDVLILSPCVTFLWLYCAEYLKKLSHENAINFIREYFWMNYKVTVLYFPL